MYCPHDDCANDSPCPKHQAARLTIRYPRAKQPLAVLAAVSPEITVEPDEGAHNTTLLVDETKEIITGELFVLRYLGRINNLYGYNALTATQIDYMLSLVGQAQDKTLVLELLKQLEPHLAYRTFLVGGALSIADLALAVALRENQRWNVLLKANSSPNVSRWYGFIVSRPALAGLIQQKTDDEKKAKQVQDSGGSYDVGLKNAEKGKVCVRFPPEPSGYLHIGHIKALLLNDYFAKMYEGRMILRFDDTNPTKEKDEFVQSIIEDCDKLGVDYGGKEKITYTSDSFDLLINYATQLIKQQDAYVDDTEMEKMREERMQKKESKARSNSVETNLQWWEEMKAGTERGQLCVLRAKIDMQSENGTLRDPTLYRCVVGMPHHRTGTKFKVYPTYDYACPIVDNKEGVTHVLRSVEFHDRDDQFRWILSRLKLRCPEIWEYSRMNFVYTFMSKRKLQWFVDQRLVQGWTDPRFPTVRGLLRRGLTVEGLREFIRGQGASRNSTYMQWDKLWSINKKVIDPIAPRYTAIAAEGARCTLSLAGATEEAKEVDLHPKNPGVGKKTLLYSEDLLIEEEDAKALQQGEEVTLIGWGNAIIEKIEKDTTGQIKVSGRLHLEGDVKATKAKLTWLALSDRKLVECTLVEVDHLITVAKLEEEQKVEDVVRPDTWLETKVWGEESLRNLKQGEIIQLQRRGFFICDRAYKSAEEPALLIYVPDGNLKAMSVLSSKVTKKAEEGVATGKTKKKQAATEVPEE